MDGQVAELSPTGRESGFKTGLRRIEAERLEKKNRKAAKQIGDIVFDKGIVPDDGKDPAGEVLEKRLTFELSTGEKMDLCLKRQAAYVISDNIEEVRADFNELSIEVVSKDG